MPFPEKQRVIYKKNPLNKVICQFRFPPILRIDSEIPSSFQDSIRSDFPLYQEKIEVQNQVALGSKGNLPPEIISHLSKTVSTKNHEFSTVDGVWKINLTRTFLSLSTSSYYCWEDFKSRLIPLYELFIKLYTPPFVTRIGLRYIDIFDRSKLGLSNTSWSELLQPYFLGLLSSEVGNKIQNSENINEILLSDDISVLRMVNSFVQNAQSQEQCYMVDSDFYFPRRIPTNEIFPKLDYLHQRATRLIQWIITSKLHEAMEPEDYEQ